MHKEVLTWSNLFCLSQHCFGIHQRWLNFLTLGFCANLMHWMYVYSKMPSWSDDNFGCLNRFLTNPAAAFWLCQYFFNIHHHLHLAVLWQSFNNNQDWRRSGIYCIDTNRLFSLTAMNAGPDPSQTVEGLDNSWRDALHRGSAGGQQTQHLPPELLLLLLPDWRWQPSSARFWSSEGVNISVVVPLTLDQ